MGNAAKAFAKVDTKGVNFQLRDVATALVRLGGIHEGLWQLQVIFAHSATNLNINEALNPSAIASVAGLRLGRVDQLDPLTVDAAKVNPGNRILRPSGAVN